MRAHPESVLHPFAGHAQAAARELIGPMEPITLLVVLSVLAVAAFDFTNGFHDTSNMVATLIASRALTPAQAIAVIVTFGFAGPFVVGTAVADTIGGFVQVADLEPTLALGIILCGLGGAIGWNLITWRFGIPSSSSHALVGALCGAVLVSAGPGHILWGGTALKAGQFAGIAKVLAALMISPALGLVVAFLLQRVLRFLLRRATPHANRGLRRAQWVTAAGIAFAHGTNDAQKGMGVLTLVLLTGGVIDRFIVPDWVILLCATSLGLGTIVGGWRIVKTLGYGIYRIRPIHAFTSQLSSAGVILSAALVGGPVSTTQVVTASIVGVGSADHPRSVHWHKAREIAWTWLFTLPCAAILGAVLFGIVDLARSLGG